jgi:hypothetical protein
VSAGTASLAAGPNWPRALAADRPTSREITCQCNELDLRGDYEIHPHLAE